MTRQDMERPIRKQILVGLNAINFDCHTYWLRVRRAALAGGVIARLIRLP
jgi:hypothetical protein